MTQDEVDLIYAYLHENYTYNDGELITKKQRGPKQKESIVGSFSHHNNGYMYNKLHMSINTKEFDINIKKLIYLYHHKEFPKYVINIDGNITNNKIENLQPSKRDSFAYNKTPKTTNKLGLKGVIEVHGKYVVHIHFQKSHLTLGRYSTKEEASDKYMLATNLANNWSGDLESFKTALKEAGFGFRGQFPAGVEKYKDKFRSRIRINKTYKNVGYFNTPEEAHAAYLKAKEEYKNG